MLGLVSIVIPTFDRKGLLAEAVASCLAQTYASVEIVIVDDGSTDGTGDFVGEKLQCEWEGRAIRYYRKENAGPAAARQYGLERAQGEFVQFLDSDDLILPDKIERQVHVLSSGSPGIVCCSCYGRKGEKAAGWERAERIGVQGRSVADYVRAMCSPVSFPMSCVAPIWRKDFLLAQAGWPSELCCGEDWAYYTALLTHAEAVGFVDAELFWACDHPGERASTTRRGKGTQRKAVSFARAWQSVCRVVREGGYLDQETSRGLLRIARSIYVLLLDIGTEEEIRGFEEAVRSFKRDAGGKVSLVTLVGWFRKVFGTSLALRGISLYLRR